MTTLTDSSDIRVLRETFVRPFYLGFLNGNFTNPHKDYGNFNQDVVRAAKDISDAQIEMLLDAPTWPDRLCASWFDGLSKRVALVSTIGELLLPSEIVYAGQGYCMALALIGSDECARLLHAYLDIYLPPEGREYNQDWAIGALTHIEGRSATEPLRQEVLGNNLERSAITDEIDNFIEIIAFMQQSGMIDRTS